MHPQAHRHLCRASCMSASTCRLCSLAVGHSSGVGNPCYKMVFLRDFDYHFYKFVLIEIPHSIVQSSTYCIMCQNWQEAGRNVAMQASPFLYDPCMKRGGAGFMTFHLPSSWFGTPLQAPLLWCLGCKTPVIHNLFPVCLCCHLRICCYLYFCRTYTVVLVLSQQSVESA